MKLLRLTASALGAALLAVLTPACEQHSASGAEKEHGETEAKTAVKSEGAAENPPQFFPKKSE